LTIAPSALTEKPVDEIGPELSVAAKGKKPISSGHLKRKISGDDDEHLWVFRLPI